MRVPTRESGEEKHPLSHESMDRHTFIWGRLDPTIATISKWADDDPTAMLRLLNDSQLQRQLLDALKSLDMNDEANERKGSA